jgi:hypothetical protein
VAEKETFLKITYSVLGKNGIDSRWKADYFYNGKSVDGSTKDDIVSFIAASQPISETIPPTTQGSWSRQWPNGATTDTPKQDKMTVDLSELKVNDYIRLREGAVLCVSKISRAKSGKFLIETDLSLRKGSGDEFGYAFEHRKDGRFFNDITVLGDIVEIIPHTSTSTTLPVDEFSETREALLKDMTERAKITADTAINPSHYQQGGIETIDAIEAWGLNFNLGNAVKYLSRAGKKDPTKLIEDLKKAVWYISREIKNLEKANA